MPRRGLVSWLIYDFANSAYATIILTFLFAPCFTRQIAPDETSGQVCWGVTLSVAGVLIAIGAPLIAATTDRAGRRKPALMAFTILAVAAVALMWFIGPGPEFLWWALARHRPECVRGHRRPAFSWIDDRIGGRATVMVSLLGLIVAVVSWLRV